jgi:hypothetical protein
MCVAFVCLHAYIFYYLPALDLNDTECTEEGEVFEYQDEDQGQAERGKPSKLVVSLILVLLTAYFTNVYENAWFILLLSLDSNY